MKSLHGLGLQIRSTELMQAYIYWRALCDGECIPSIEEFNLSEIPELKPFAFEVVVPDDPKDMVFSLLGSAITEYLESNPTGMKIIDHFKEDSVEHLLDGYIQVVATSRPHYLEDSQYTGHNSSLIYSRLLCPLSDDGFKVNRIIGITSFNDDFDKKTH